MIRKRDNKKVFRDPIYGYINVEYDFISDLIDSNEFQRLRRIRQLSGVSMVFHGAEHSRFSHSIGVYGLAYKVLQEQQVIKNYLNEYEQVVFLTAALLHDIGHGPYSHSFEHVFGLSHEAYSAKIIRHSTGIASILDQVSESLKEDVCSVILKQGKFKIIEQLISSQLDVDRMDYLERDSYFTGAKYGNIDKDRIIRMMTIKDNIIVFKEGAIHAIENYLISRYHMYWQVYYHPVARSYEIILEQIYLRMLDLIKDKQLDDDYSLYLKNVIENQEDITSYLELDDYYVNGLIKRYRHHKDVILNTLCNDFLDRHLFSYETIKDTSDERILEIKALVNDNNYFYKIDQVSQVTYLLNEFDIVINRINILMKDGEIKKLDQVSPIVKGLSVSGIKTDCKLFFRHV